jgi:hypothetical protein
LSDGDALELRRCVLVTEFLEAVERGDAEGAEVAVDVEVGTRCPQYLVAIEAATSAACPP